MWFCKLFRRNKDEDYEPAAHAPPPSAQTKGVNGQASSAPKTASTASKPKSDYGFDPYNSGAFEKHNAWERISRR